MRRASVILTAALLFGSPVLAQEQNPADTIAVPQANKVQTPAEQRAAELDRLFGQLHAAEATVNPVSIEQKIWSVWARNDSTTAELLLSQAGRAMAAEQYDAAQTMLDTLIAERPDFAEAWNRRATLYFKMRRYEQSLADIEKVLELEPRHFGALSGKGAIMMALDRPDEALAAYHEALAINPHMAAVSDAVKKLEKERPDI